MDNRTIHLPLPAGGRMSPSWTGSRQMMPDGVPDRGTLAAGRCLCVGLRRAKRRHTGPRRMVRRVPCRRARRPYKRLTLEIKITRSCLRESADGPPRRMYVAPAFLDLKLSRFASTNATSRFENPRTRKCGFLLMFVHVCSPARSPTRRRTVPPGWASRCAPQMTTVLAPPRREA